MSAESLRLEAGTRMLFEGDPVTVVGFDGRRVTLRWDGGRRVQSLSVAVVAAGPRQGVPVRACDRSVRPVGDLGAAGYSVQADGQADV